MKKKLFFASVFFAAVTTLCAWSYHKTSYRGCCYDHYQMELIEAQLNREYCLANCGSDTTCIRACDIVFATAVQEANENYNNCLNYPTYPCYGQ